MLGLACVPGESCWPGRVEGEAHTAAPGKWAWALGSFGEGVMGALTQVQVLPRSALGSRRQPVTRVKGPTCLEQELRHLLRMYIQKLGVLYIWIQFFLLSYYVPGAVLGTRDTAVNRKRPRSGPAGEDGPKLRHQQ